MRTLLFAAAAMALSSPAAASPLNPWGVHVGKGVFGLTPFVFVGLTPWVNPLVYGQYGITDGIDLMAGAGATVVPGFSFDTVELMPRYFLAEHTAVALHATFEPAGAVTTLAPEYHGIYELGPIGLTANVGWGPQLSSAGFSAGTVYAFIAPELPIAGETSVYLELDPSYDLTAATDPFYMEVVPGVSTGFAETHYFSLGVGIPVTGFSVSSIYAGIWYSIAFGGAEE